jgi:hypothetical protein
VVVGRAAHERRDGGHDVTDLEAEPVGEEALRRGLVGGSDDHVAQLARTHGPVAVQSRSSRVRTVGPSRSVVRGRRHSGLLQLGQHLDDGPEACDRLDRLDPAPGDCRDEAEALDLPRDAVDVVLVRGAHGDLDDLATRGVDEPKLRPAIRRGVPAVARRAQTEVDVVGSRLGDVRNPDRHRSQSM